MPGTSSTKTRFALLPGMTARRSSLKQTALTNRLNGALGRCGLLFACDGLRRTRHRRPAGICRGRHVAVGKFQIEPRSRSDAGRGVHGMALLIAYQRKTARQHAAIRQRPEQLAAMGDTRLEPLHHHCERAPRAFGQALRAFAVARDRVAPGLRVGEL